MWVLPQGAAAAMVQQQQQQQFSGGDTRNDLHVPLLSSDGLPV
jgi:hypothetical protein